MASPLARRQASEGAGPSLSWKAGTKTIRRFFAAFLAKEKTFLPPAFTGSIPPCRVEHLRGKTCPAADWEVRAMRGEIAILTRAVVAG
jgi:hypothetical protein